VKPVQGVAHLAPELRQRQRVAVWRLQGLPQEPDQLVGGGGHVHPRAAQHCVPQHMLHRAVNRGPQQPQGHVLPDVAISLPLCQDAHQRGGIAPLQGRVDLAEIVVARAPFGQDEGAQPRPLGQQMPQMGMHKVMQLRARPVHVRQVVFHLGDDFVIPVADHPHAQFPLAAEVREDRGFGHAQALGDLGGGGGLEAGLGKHLPGHVQDVPYALFGLGAGGRAADRNDGSFFHANGKRAVGRGLLLSQGQASSASPGRFP